MTEFSESAQESYAHCPGLTLAQNVVANTLAKWKKLEPVILTSAKVFARQ